MKMTGLLRTLAIILALLFVLTVFVACDENTTKEIIKHDNYIEEIEYNSNDYVIKYLYRKINDNSIISHTDLEYDEVGNMIKESLYYGDDEVAFVYTEFSYSENGALTNEAKYYNSGEKHIYEYDVVNNTNKHEHFFLFNDYYEYAVYTYSYDFGYNGSEPGILLYDMSVISAASYADDGTLLRQAKREYDENGNYVLIDNIYNEDGSNFRDIVFYQNGEIKEETFYYEDSIHIYEYNENREKIKEKIIESNGCYHTIEYENGEYKRQIAYNADGTIWCICEPHKENSQKDIYTYYDKYGNIDYIEEMEWDNNGNILNITTYDANGNIIE